MRRDFPERRKKFDVQYLRVVFYMKYEDETAVKKQIATFPVGKKKKKIQLVIFLLKKKEKHKEANFHWETPEKNSRLSVAKHKTKL